MGLFVPGVEVPNVDDDEADLEAELNQLMGGGHQAKKKAVKPPVKVADLDKMVAACMADDDFDDGDVDDDDPDLLSELAQLEGGDKDISDDENFAGGNDICPGGVSLLATINERLGMYASAEAAAKQVIIKRAASTEYSNLYCLVQALLRQPNRVYLPKKLRFGNISGVGGKFGA